MALVLSAAVACAVSVQQELQLGAASVAKIDTPSGHGPVQAETTALNIAAPASFAKFSLPRAVRALPPPPPPPSPIQP